MTHRSEHLAERLNQDLDDLEVRNPKQAEVFERKLRRLELEANFAVSQSHIPAGIRSMERSK